MRRHAAVTSVTANAGTAPVVSLRHDMAVQTRSLGAGIDLAGDAIVGGGLVLVAYRAGRAVHTPLPDDERACAFGYHSRSARK